MKLLESFRAASARRHFSPRTIQCYESWSRNSSPSPGGFGGQWRHPRELRGPEVEPFLNHLALDRQLSGSSQNQRTLPNLLTAVSFAVCVQRRSQLGRVAAFGTARRRTTQVIAANETQAGGAAMMEPRPSPVGSHDYNGADGPRRPERHP